MWKLRALLSRNPLTRQGQTAWGNTTVCVCLLGTRPTVQVSILKLNELTWFSRLLWTEIDSLWFQCSSFYTSPIFDLLFQFTFKKLVFYTSLPNHGVIIIYIYIYMPGYLQDFRQCVKRIFLWLIQSCFPVYFKHECHKWHCADL